MPEPIFQPFRDDFSTAAPAGGGNGGASPGPAGLPIWNPGGGEEEPLPCADPAQFPLRRRRSRAIAVGGIPIGGGAPVVVQSMCNTYTHDVEATLAQIGRLEEAGCEIVRLAVPDERAAEALREIRPRTSVPLVADIHFDHRLALMAADAGVDCLRINPMTRTIARKKAMREDAAKKRDSVAARNDIGMRLVDMFDASIAPPNGITVSGYYPIGSEANALPLLRVLAERGYTVALPVVPRRGEPLVFRRWRATDAMDAGPFGIREPRADAPSVRPDLILTPLLAFDRRGNRLGYGGGFYDVTIRSLREFQPVLAVGIAYSAQEVELVPHGERDVPLDWVVTEREAIRAVRGET